MSPTVESRPSQRQPLCCSSCAQSKIRCSKTIPCLSCIDRGQAETCRREVVQITAGRKRRRTSNFVDNTLGSGVAQELPCPFESGGTEQLPVVTSQSASPAASTVRPHSRVPTIQNDAAITLEFLSHGRQSILRTGDRDQRKVPASAIGTTDPGALQVGNDWDLVFSLEQARSLLAYHQDNVAWMHNVVHMPTFRKQLETYFLRPLPDKSWVALYYAVICSTVYHADDTPMLALEITRSASVVQMLYDRSIQALHDADFMAIHSLTSVQAVCVLLQVAHNLDQSDRIQVLLSAAIRISQSLGLNRMGADQETYSGSLNGMTITQFLIDREVKKRTWWFLVRQDWLQIPFQNTFVIHANQFNTPMPLNCYEQEETMVCDGRIVVQPSSTYTQTSYSLEIHQVAVIIWKHQDRMCAVGHPGNTREGLLRLYDQTLWADKELKQKYREMPVFFRERSPCVIGLPDYIGQLAPVQLLSTAHKIHTVHRYFQLQSFRDRTFAFTQHSCVAISKRCIEELEDLLVDGENRMAMKMWTVITHIITCCINLTFASIFREENSLLYDGMEMQRLARVGREAVRIAEEWSSIARRGGVLLDALFEIEDSICWLDQAQFSMEDIIQRVLQVDGTIKDEFSLAPDLLEAQFDFSVDWSMD